MTFEIISTRQLKREIYLKKPKDIFDLVKKYAKSRQEQFLVVTLDGSNKVISIHIMSIGLVNKTMAHPREVFYHAIKDNAVSLVLAHNHPSGHISVSEEDNEITKIIVDASKIMKFHVIDHIIFSKSNFISMREDGFYFGD